VEAAFEGHQSRILRVSVMVKVKQNAKVYPKVSGMAT